MSAREKIIEAIKGFNWGNYSLDEVEMGLADYPDLQDWVPALADRICAAIDDQPFHVLDVGEDGWTLKHPLDCRDDLFNCPFNQAAERMRGPIAEVGQWRVELGEPDGDLFAAARADAPGVSE
jgi:hypothetical protein